MNKVKISDWRSVWALPLDPGCILMVYSWNDVLAITFDRKVPKTIRKAVIDCINGSKIGLLPNVKKEGCCFSVNGKKLFDVRGWGHLTGRGALNLPEKKAIEIQNQFIEYIYERLTKSGEDG